MSRHIKGFGLPRHALSFCFHYDCRDSLYCIATSRSASLSQNNGPSFSDQWRFLNASSYVLIRTAFSIALCMIGKHRFLRCCFYNVAVRKKEYGEAISIKIERIS
jgi:hypothetical protein